MTTTNTLPNINSIFDVEDADKWAQLPAHVMDITTHACIYCGTTPIWDSYEEYTNHFWEKEWEGERYHCPDDREEWELLTCLCG